MSARRTSWGLMVAGLALGCTASGRDAAPLEVRAIELEGCGAIADMVEVGGRLYGVSDATPSASGASSGFVCAFDVDRALAEPRVDRLAHEGGPLDGVAAQLVEPDGHQTIAASWQVDGNQLALAVFERDAEGVERLDPRPAVASERRLDPGRIRALRSGGELLIVYSPVVHGESCGNSRDTPPRLFAWTPAAASPSSISEGLVGDAVIDADELDELIIAGPIRPPATESRNSMDVGLFDTREVAVHRPGPEPSKPRWRTRIPTPGEDPPRADVLDLELVDGRVFVLATDGGEAWLSALAAEGGELGWSVGLGEGSEGALAPGRDGGVLVVTYAIESKNVGKLRRVEVSADGELGTPSSRTVRLPDKADVGSITLGSQVLVWLGGGFEDDEGWPSGTAWLGSVALW